MAKNPKAFQRRQRPDIAYAGEGELHQLLRVVGLTKRQFIELSGISPSVFSRWYGHPMHPWPIELLRWYGYSMAMERVLLNSGYDVEPLKPKLPTLLPAQGRYPRNEESRPIPRPEDYSPWKK